MLKTKTADEPAQSVYIDPLSDFGFKKIFLNKDLLIAFLNDVIGIDIQDIQYQPTEGLGEQVQDRIAVFDLLCTTQSGEYFIVEMQLKKQSFFRDRVLFYASHLIRKQAPRKKDWNYELKAVYVVSILDFITFKEETAKKEVIEWVYLYREKAKMQYSTKLNFIFIELPKFRKRASELENARDTWLFLLKHAFELKFCPPEITDNKYKQFLETAEVKHLTSTEMETYKKSLKQNYFLRDITECAKQEGKLEGKQEGKQEGKMESLMEVATRLLQRKMPIEDIISLTDLTKEQVEELLKQ